MNLEESKAVKSVDDNLGCLLLVGIIGLASLLIIGWHVVERLEGIEKTIKSSQKESAK